MIDSEPTTTPPADEPVAEATGVIGSSRDLTHLLRRLVAGWRAARVRLGLPAAASFADIARRLDVDRGTAQRLNRIGKLADASPSDLEQFPGVRAWHRIVAGAGQALGADDPAVAALRAASEQFAEYLAGAGGSRSAVVRHLKAEVKAEGTNGSGGGGHPTAEQAIGPSVGAAAATRAAWVQSAADVMGYCADVRLDLQLVRESAAPADGSPRQLDLAMVNVLHGCRGRPGAMPLAFVRQSRPPAFPQTPVEGSAVPWPFRLLRAGTSRPAPAVLTTGDAVHHTMFVEPQWATSPNPLDLALLQGEATTTIASPWGTALEWLEFACVNRHPCRRLVLDRLVSREKDAVVVPSLAAFRSHTNLSHDEPWFDRLPQDGTVRRLGTPAEAAGDDPFPGYSDVLAEALEALAWSTEELILYRAVVDNPIPLATYTLMFDRVKA